MNRENSPRRSAEYPRGNQVPLPPQNTTISTQRSAPPITTVQAPIPVQPPSTNPTTRSTTSSASTHPTFATLGTISSSQPASSNTIDNGNGQKLLQGTSEGTIRTKLHPNGLHHLRAQARLTIEDERGFDIPPGIDPVQFFQDMEPRDTFNPNQNAFLFTLQTLAGRLRFQRSIPQRWFPTIRCHGCFDHRCTRNCRCRQCGQTSIECQCDRLYCRICQVDIFRCKCNDCRKCRAPPSRPCDCNHTENVERTPVSASVNANGVISPT